jgi:ankyrin repeat protein
MSSSAADADDTIQIASGDGRLDAVKAFAAGKSAAALDAGDAAGYTALHAASSYAQTEVVAWLLAAGASPAVVDNDGDTPLHLCEGGAAAAALLAGGAPLTAANGAGESAFAVAVKERRAEVVEVLREAYLARALELPDVVPSDDEEEEEDYDEDDDNEEAADNDNEDAAAALAAQMAALGSGSGGGGEQSSGGAPPPAPQ